MEQEIDVNALVEAHHTSIWRYLRYLGCDRATADDLTQETFVAVVEKPFQWRGRHEAATYLRSIARNLFLTQIRRSSLIQTVDDLDAADAAWERAHGDDSDARQQALAECLEAVQGKSKQVLYMQYWEKRSSEDVARALNLSAKNVRVIVHRARLALKTCIEKKLA